jgi:Fur family transcriptional regulator, ferric uptake regulator
MPHDQWVTETLNALQEAGYRQGGARRSVIEFLGSQDCCLSAQEIAHEMRAEGRAVGVASVYRVLDLLAENGFAQRLMIGGTARYEPFEHGGDHHHHLVCDDCGRVEAFADEGLESALEQVETSSGYAVAGHEVVVRGACGECRAEPAAAAS